MLGEEFVCTTARETDMLLCGGMLSSGLAGVGFGMLRAWEGRLRYGYMISTHFVKIQDTMGRRFGIHRIRHDTEGRFWVSFSQFGVGGGVLPFVPTVSKSPIPECLR
jgi:hypothetical protein